MPIKVLSPELAGKIAAGEVEVRAVGGIVAGYLLLLKEIFLDIRGER